MRLLVLFLLAGSTVKGQDPVLVNSLRPMVMKEAVAAMKEAPVTVTASHSPRSAGGRHDFFSEADYFWPNPISPDSPYINRDGQTNPGNFNDHRVAMIRLSRVVGALASAWMLTHDDRYVLQALKHCRAWFVDTATMMNPDLQYSQAIKGRVTGRNYGIIDTIHLMEVVQGLEAMEASQAMDAGLLARIRGWFARYLRWLTTHPYGVQEMNTLNNHSTCWVEQVAAFARFTGNDSLMNFCRERYKTVLLPNQMAADGSFPLELTRTKPYGYSLFNLDAMATICQILSTPGDDLWHFTTPDGRSIQKGIEYLYPFIADKGKWPYAHDIMYWDQWPVAPPALVFGAEAFGRKDWLETWVRLDHQPENAEVIRNLPVRHPLIWMEERVVPLRKEAGATMDRGRVTEGVTINAGEVMADAERQTRELLLTIDSVKPADVAGAEPGSPPFSPRTIENGRLKLVVSRDWTSGYFPGELWMLYHYTGRDEWRQLAQRFTAAMEREKTNGGTHDMGLKINCSFGLGYRYTDDPKYKQVMIDAARVLSTRFNPKIGCIRSWDHHRELWQYPVIIDNMMNLELLFEATRLTGDSSFYRIAVTHANTTMKNHFRKDYSSYHLVEYDTVTGRVRRKMTWQGYSDSSAWARGQSWGVYGYTMCYRYTHDPRYLRQAEHIATFILNHPRLPKDKVPYWDYDAPGIPRTGKPVGGMGAEAADAEPRDASAAAILASGLYELARYSTKGPLYRATADTILANLTDYYRAPIGTNKGFILLHSTGGKPTNTEVDEPLSYADYYYLEALLRRETLLRDGRMAWWREARFGMFIHWGVYSVLAGEYDGHTIGKAAEWIMNRGKIPVAEYRQVARRFNPVKYDPDAWVRLARDAGMKYIVITAKHHDGFALFDSKASPWNVVDATPYSKDLLKPLAAACRKYGIRLGFYYSQAQDWNNPGGAASRKLTSEGWADPDSAKIDAYTAAHSGHWDPAQTKASMGDYMDRVSLPQVRELLTNYGDVAVLWWDTPTGMTDEYAEKLQAQLRLQPDIITNDRLKRPNFPGDYKTPEQKIPNLSELDGKDWETCMTMNGTWGFKASDHNWKTPAALVRNLIDIASKGGNYLLNVGPTAEGEIPQPSVDALKAIGAWMKVNGEAIYGTQKSPLPPLTWGRCTVKGDVYYLSVFEWPADGKLVVAGFSGTVERASLLSSGKLLKTEASTEGLVIHLPPAAADAIATVIRVEGPRRSR